MELESSILVDQQTNMSCRSVSGVSGVEGKGRKDKGRKQGLGRC